jgi:predicted type IV restriction endonuclease
VFVLQFLEDGLGFNLNNEVKAQYPIDVGTSTVYADYALKVGRPVVALVEVKKVTAKLPGPHVRQTLDYPIFEGLEWAILTNGRSWRMYHTLVRKGSKPQFDPVRVVDLLDDGSPAHLATEMLYFTREYFMHDLLGAIWREQQSTSPATLSKAILSTPVVKAIRSEVHKLTGCLVTQAELKTALAAGVLRQGDTPK